MRPYWLPRETDDEPAAPEEDKEPSWDAVQSALDMGDTKRALRLQAERHGPSGKRKREPVAGEHYIPDPYERTELDPDGELPPTLEEDHHYSGIIGGVDVDEINRLSHGDDAAPLGLVEDISLDVDPREPQTWFLGPRLKAFFELWQSRVAGSSTDQWTVYWRTQPNEAEAIEAEWIAACESWFEDVGALDITTLKTTDDGSIRSRVYAIDQRLRTYVLLAYPVTAALSMAHYVRRTTGDGYQHRRELMAHPTFAMWQPIRGWVYSQTEKYKAHKQAYNAEHEKDPSVRDRRAAQRRERTAREKSDPTFLEREAERKRKSREVAKVTKDTLDKV